MAWHTIQQENSPHFICSVEQEEESLQTFCLDTYLSELAKSRNTQGTFCSQDSETESCQPSQSGTMFVASTEHPGEDQLMFFAEDSHAKTSLPLEMVQELRANALACGKNMQDSLMRCGLNLSLPKTHRCLEPEDLEPSSKTLPTWGMMQDGVCLELAMSVRRIKEKECGSWPTPTVAEATKIPATANYGQVGLNNHPAIRGLPTRPKLKKDGGTRTQQKWPTPLASCGSKPDSDAERRRNSPHMESAVKLVEGLPVKERRPLNPSWVEWLMGWPIGWTDLKPLVTDRFRNVQQWHSIFSQKD